MEKDTNTLEVVGLTIIGLMVIPVVIQGAAVILDATINGISNGINTIKFNRRMKKGLKDGSIVKIDGQFYNVPKDCRKTVEEA